MKSINLFILCISLFSSSLPGATVTFDLSQSGKKIAPAQMAGTCLPVWNSADIYKEIKKGLVASNYRLFRFPNGSISNGYHWNGSGSYSADGIWTCDTAKYLPGFVSMTKYRGTSLNNYGFSGCSNITDGDTSTFWQSDGSDTENLPYCYLEFPVTGLVDSIVILWGDNYAVDFDVDFYGVMGSFSPGPFKCADDQWIPVKQVTGNAGKTSAFWLDSAGATRYLRVIARKFAPSQRSVQVREIYCFSKGKQITVNAKRYDGTSGSQTRVIAEPTFAGNVVRPDAASWKTWHFESFMDYVKSIDSAAIPLVCVDYGTGTPEEAAAWVYYANVVKKYGIKFWQVGNEMDGEWEEGGPVSARIYAEKFLRFSRAMKKVDPTIKVLGPVLSNADFNAKNSGSFDGKSWMQEFMEYIGGKERTDSAKFCDGIDFHSYPYWSGAPTAPAMMAKIDYAADQCDSLVAWIKSDLTGPDSIYVMMSEFNSSVVMSDLLQKRINGVFLANMYAAHIGKFGGRAMSVVWDSYEAGDLGPLMSWGATSLFNALPGSQYSSMSKAPSSVYWGLYLLQNVWIDPKKENTFLPATYSKADSIRAYGMKTDSDFSALFINCKSDSLPVECSLAGGSYPQAEVYTWGPSEFNWVGFDKNSYAFPNCGPSSRRVAAADVKNLKIPPLSLCVVRYFAPDSDDLAPAILHFGSKDRICYDTQRLVFYGTVCGGRNAVRKIDYAIDSGNYTSVSPVDGAFDGPFENIADSIAVTSFSYGKHLFSLRARTRSSAATIDTFSFFVLGKLYPVALIDNFADSDFVPVLPGSTSWRAGAGSNTGTSITPAIKVRNGGDDYCNGDFTIAQPPGLGYENFVQINSFADSNYIKANAGRFKGITFSYATTHSSATGEFFVHILSRKVLDNKDWCEFYVQLPATGGAWRTVTYGWGDFRQYPWGIQVGMLDAADVRGFEFRAQGAGQGSFAFDNIAFLGDSGTQINLPVGRPAAKTAGLAVRETRTPGGIRFTVSGRNSGSTLMATVYAIDGRVLRVLSGVKKGQTSVISWNYDREGGMPVAKGVYFMVIRAGKNTIRSNKVIVQ